MTTSLYTEISQCRVCGSTSLQEARAFSGVLPAGLYTTTPVQARLPLTLLQCEGCGHAQLRELISEAIYEQYIYVTPPASFLSDYLHSLAADLKSRFSLQDKNIFEIGSSNASFLSLFADDNRVSGIEPSVKLVDAAREEHGIETRQGYLGQEKIEEIFDMIFCRHVLEHINDLEGFLDAVIALCRPGTLFLVEVPSFDRTVAAENFSNIFHEHVNYFSHTVLERLCADRGFRRVHDYENDIHGGSMGLVFEYVAVAVPLQAGAIPVAADLFRNFDHWLQQVQSLLQGERYIGYGAAHRTFTLLSLLGLADKMDYLVDQNPGYQGHYIGGTGIEICPVSRLQSENGKEVILFATSYEKEILSENAAVLRQNTFICIGTRPRRVQYSHILGTAVRRHILGMKHRSGSSHAGSALSITDILAVLYGKVLNVDPTNPCKRDRDRFILSKGHASAALYATLAESGFFPTENLQGFYTNDGALPGHVDMTAAPGIEASSGSLGHGLSLGLGMALAQKADSIDARVFVLCGNGELDEGSVWEAIMYAPRKALDNLVLIIDHNRLQGYTTDGEDQGESIARRIAAFGWRVLDVDGHDHEALTAALMQKSDCPLAIVAETVKGKGVSFMENEFVWHYKSPNAEQYSQAMQELE